jgi:hypothetical protein
VRRIEIYVDEDVMDSDLVAALRSRGVTVTTAWDANLVGEADAEQLGFAGMILASQHRFSVSSCAESCAFVLL